jgi:riboflavin biosynthesis pyrimidine reductase
MIKTFLFVGMAGYCGDSVWFGGVHAASVLHVLRAIAHGILMGIGHLI